MKHPHDYGLGREAPKGASALLDGGMTKTYVYVDGFNLYYGCLKGTDFKWLNLQKLCEFLLPQNRIEKIYYFTAQVSGTPDDPDKPQRQLKYIRALKTIPNLEIIEGKFIVENVELPKADGSGFVEVVKTKEKRSDVNLTSMLLWDAHCRHFETAVLISGDTDFYAPLLMIKTRFKKTIGILDPQRDGHPATRMNKEASFYKKIREGVLAECQFPHEMQDDKGKFYKPGDWFKDGMKTLI
jgi:hypothetical protein